MHKHGALLASIENKRLRSQFPSFMPLVSSIEWVASRKRSSKYNDISNLQAVLFPCSLKHGPIEA